MSETFGMSKNLEEASKALGPEFEAALRKLFLHAKPKCEHTFGGWRAFEDGNGGEQFCSKCGLGAMAHSMWEF